MYIYVSMHIISTLLHYINAFNALVHECNHFKRTGLSFDSKPATSCVCHFSRFLLDWGLSPNRSYFGDSVDPVASEVPSGVP